MNATDRIQKKVLLRAPQGKVWHAVSDAQEFGTWFRLRLDGDFVPGKTVYGVLTDMPQYAHLRFEMRVDAVEPQRLFSFRWHPAAIDKDVDYSKEPMTLVTFELAPAEEGTTWLTITESGFESIPPHRRLSAFLMNDEGWTIQSERITTYVEAI
jgi:uncharacterized protein YndB with AHSA1/START domain